MKAILYTSFCFSSAVADVLVYDEVKCLPEIQDACILEKLHVDVLMFITGVQAVPTLGFEKPLRVEYFDGEHLPNACFNLFTSYPPPTIS